MSDPLVSRALGGSPLSVLIRLAVVSLLVGALMSWLHVDPLDLVAAIERGFVRLWGTGFEAVANLGRTALAGAAIVIPVWLLLRILSYRGPRRRDPDLQPAARWTAPDRVGDER